MGSLITRMIIIGLVSGKKKKKKIVVCQNVRIMPRYLLIFIF